MKIKYKPVHDMARTPEYASAEAAGFDLRCVEGGHADAHTACILRTGLVFEVPRGYVMLLFSRSGHGFKHGVRLANCVGVIDSDYRGEVLVKLHNDTSTPFYFEPGDRIAQAMVLPLERASFTMTTDVSDTVRGAGGFGSTGVA